MHNTENADFYVFACINWGVVEIGLSVGTGREAVFPERIFTCNFFAVVIDVLEQRIG